MLATQALLRAQFHSTMAAKSLKQGTLFSFFTKAPPVAASPTIKKDSDSLPASKPNQRKGCSSEKVCTNATAATLLPGVGDRIEVYWKDDDDYYASKVVERRGEQFLLQYDQDGDTEWLDLAQETFRFLNGKQPEKKRRRILHNDDDDDYSAEVEFDDEDSEEELQCDDPEEDNNEAQWMVTDDEEDGSSRKRKQSSKKSSGSMRKSFKVLEHPVAQNRTAPLSSLSQLGYTPNNKKQTPSVTPSTANKSIAGGPSSTLASPPPSARLLASAVTTPPGGKEDPPKYVDGAANPAGSHVHNHLKFLQNPKDSQGHPIDHPDYDARTLKVDYREWKARLGKDMTDAVKQWWELKAQYFDTVLLFKTGKFYEMFHMDADVGVSVLGLLYMKGAVAHAGFPEISYGTFADQLVRAGYRVARVEQTETPEMLKIRKQQKRSGEKTPKVVNREVCSVLTLGTRTFCYLDDSTAALDRADDSSSSVGPLLAIREVLMLVENEGPGEEGEVKPVCEYGITLVDALRGTVTIGQFADDVLRSRLNTLLAAYAPSEILLHGSETSPTLQSLISSFQKSCPYPLGISSIRATENFPSSTALDASVRRQLDRGRVQPWNVEETVRELHRRKYYPSSSKKTDAAESMSRWPVVLRAAVEGNAELAMSSLGAVLFYLQRNLIDGELLSMGIVKAYIPPASTTSTVASQEATLQQQQESGDMVIEEIIAGPAVAGIQGRAMVHTPSTPLTQLADTNSSSQLENQIGHMAVDGTTLHNLEILTNAVDYKESGSLWSRINNTKTPHGARMLRAWLLRPLFRKSDIDRRANAVEELVAGAASVARSEATTILKKCGDIERLLSRIHSMSGSARLVNDEDDNNMPGVHPNERAILYETGTYTQRKVRDFSKVLNGLRFATQIPETFQGIEIESGLLNKIVRHRAEGGCFPDMMEELDWFFSNFDCDLAAKGLFEPSRGVDEAYDEACETIEQVQSALNDYKNEMCDGCLQPRSLAKSSWKYINVKPDSKDKYIIELPASIRVPDEFIMKGKRGSGHKQVNKYRTQAVQELVDQLQKALDIQRERKAKGMQLIFAKFDSKRNMWAAAAQATALLDALSSLAVVASKPGYVRPEILNCQPDQSPTIFVKQGRHPCVEHTLGSTEFVPNDLFLGSETNGEAQPRVLLLSGPNMGGKSTLLRQTCLLCILAQLGSFVPAESCSLTPIDRVYTRLGASDRLLLGQSTFFVELAETAAALRGATRRSLVIMDELGRGTSTFDGTAIASATVKHLVERSQCLCLFATHYHSLLDEWKLNCLVRLGHMQCIVGQSSGDDKQQEDTSITFLYTLGPGACPKSFGINVARLAGLPETVLKNAKRISAEFEQQLSDTYQSATLLKRRVVQAMKGNNWDLVYELWKQVNVDASK